MSVASPRKRQKTIHSFFNSKVNNECTHQTDAKSQLPLPGLHLIEDFVTPAEEQQLLTFLSTQSWRTDLARQVIHYGGTYCLMPPRDATPAEREKISQQILIADPIPTAFTFLISRMVQLDLYCADAVPGFCIVNEYTGNQGISAHVENFRFGEPVCGLTLGHGDKMRFHELAVPDDGSVRSGKAALAERTGRRHDVWLEARSLVVMTGESRRKWQHEIVRSKAGRSMSWKRTSLTFRVLAKAQKRSDPEVG